MTQPELNGVKGLALNVPEIKKIRIVGLQLENTKLMELMRVRAGTSFAPNGVLRLELSEEERGQVLAVARRVLLEIKAEN